MRHRPSGRAVTMPLWRGKIKPPVELVVANLPIHWDANRQESLRIVALAALGVLGMENVIGTCDDQSAQCVYDAIMGLSIYIRKTIVLPAKIAKTDLDVIIDGIEEGKGDLTLRMTDMNEGISNISNFHHYGSCRRK